MGQSMGDDRALAALGRIERALARVEAAADRPAPTLSTSDDTALREAHEALRGKVGEAIAQLDHLLGAEG
jgi:hypothetical protein